MEEEDATEEGEEEEEEEEGQVMSESGEDIQGRPVQCLGRSHTPVLALKTQSPSEPLTFNKSCLVLFISVAGLSKI